MPIFDIPLWTLFLQAISALLLLSVLGSLVAIVLRLLGDPGPSYDGRQTPNPALQVSIWSIVAAAVVRIGGIKPLDIAPEAVKWGGVGIAVAVLTGSAALVGLGNLAALLGPKMVSFFQPPFGLQLSVMLATFSQMAVLLAVINLLPLPPFAMGHVLKATSPSLFAKLAKYSGWIVIALAFAFYMLGRNGGLQEIHRGLASLLLWGKVI